MRHFLDWMMYRIRGGRSCDKELSEKEATAFLKGTITCKAAEAVEAAGGGESKLWADAQEDVTYVRRDGGAPSILAQDSEIRSSARMGAE